MARPDGLDIFAQDFIREQRAFIASRESTDVQKFFGGTNIFITGGTGFVGKALIEKLLRSTEGNTIYLLIRPKFGKSATERLTDLLNTPIFRNVKAQNPEVVNRVKLIVGDLSLPDLGLDPDDKELLIEDIEIVIHCASTEIFDTRLRLAIETNIRGTRDLVEIISKMRQLKSFVHLSSAFSNCPREVIEERIYTPPDTYKKLLDLINILDDTSLITLEQSLMKEWPNPYTYTKQVAESLIKDKAKNLPVAILRPGIAVCAVSDPTVGWVDTLMGPQGIVYSCYIGCQRVVQANEKCRIDLVPVDYVANAIITLAWDIGSTRGDNPNIEQLSYNDALLEELDDNNTDVQIVNLVSGTKNPITWGVFLRHCLAEGLGLPSVKQFSVPSLSIKSSSRTVFFYQLYFHILPAILFDLFYAVRGSNSMFIQMYRNLHNYSFASSYFSLQEWTFVDNNAWTLYDKLSARDKVIFNFDVRQLVWTEYLRLFVRGLRIYIAGDAISSLPEANQRLTRLKVQYYLGWTVTYIILAFIFYVILF